MHAYLYDADPKTLGANPKTLVAIGGFTKVYSGVQAFRICIYKVLILRPMGQILRPWAPTLVLLRPRQVFEHSRCKFVYKVPVLRPRGANPKTLGANGGFTKVCSGV